MLGGVVNFPWNSLFKVYSYTDQQTDSIWFHWKFGYLKLFFLRNSYFFYLFTKFFLLLPLHTHHRSLYSPVNNLSKLFNMPFSWFYTFFFSSFVPFRVKFHLSGLGNRIHLLKDFYLVVKLGYAHKVRIQQWDESTFFQPYRKKQSILVRSNSYSAVLTWVNMFRRLKVPDCYNGNGVRFYNEKLVFRYRKRWGVI